MLTKKDTLLILSALAIGLSGQQGCHSYSHAVVAATGTSIGVEISENPATQVPQAKLGYHRVELAIVPTNRSADRTTTQANSMGEGAKDHGDVIMEVRYGGIFDFGKSSGIYQRLAVGKTAVSQPGASLMFAKDADGDLTSSAADALIKTTESAAFAAKLTGERGLTTVALLQNVYSALIKLGKPAPEGQDDAKARNLKTRLDALVSMLPDTYPFDVYRQEEPTRFKTEPKMGDPITKTGAEPFRLVLDYQSQLVDSINHLEKMVRLRRDTFTVDCPQENVQPNCDNGVPETVALQKVLGDQKAYFKEFTDKWGQRPVVLQAVDYYFASQKKSDTP